MHKISDWIAKHQVTSFLLLVFGVSWPSMLMIFYVAPQNAGIQALFGLVAVFSPAVAAVLLSTIARPGPKQGRKAPRWTAFLVAWIFAWLVTALHAWQIRGLELEPQIVIPVGLVALLPAWLISGSFSRLSSVRELLGTLLRPRGNVGWYVVALFIIPAVQLLGAGITAVGGGEVSFNINRPTFAGGVAMLCLVFLEGFLLSGGINEETGWRAFLVPRLQARFPVIMTIVLVWFFWALWHLPYDIGQHTPLQAILLNRILHNFIFVIIMIWLFNRTRGSLLAPALFHPSMNTFGESFPRTDISTVLFVILVLAIIVHERMWRKLPADHPAVHS